MLFSRSLSFVFPLFYFFSCWLSSTYDLIWIFVAFLAATGVVSLKSEFAIRYQHVPSLSFFFLSFIYIHLFIWFLVLLWFFKLGSFILARVTRELTTLPQIGANKIQRVRLDGMLYRSFFFLVNFFQRDFNWATIQFIYLADIFSWLDENWHIDIRDIE